MITGCAIILENDILYCSNENKYTTFEIILFIEKLLSAINPKQTWRLNSIYLEGYSMGKERIVIKHIVTKNNQNLFYCISGNFTAGSREAFNMLEEFYEKVNANYKTTELLKESSRKPIFKEIIETIMDYLWDKYENLLKEEEIQQDVGVSIKSKIIYCGISIQGLPIISQLYDKTLLSNIDKEINDENIELYTSNLSAGLATIAMNILIRAKNSIKEIHICDLEEKETKKIILYGDINEMDTSLKLLYISSKTRAPLRYSLDFFASGDFYKLKEVFEQLKNELSKEECLQEKFSGDLKPYRNLQKYFDEIAIIEELKEEPRDGRR